jgi:Aromatic-ring-opening dioxygenase LigAB, LigA subunit
VYGVQKFLWELRRDPALAERFKQDPEPTLESYGVPENERRALLNKDFKSFYDAGINPYILYFGALQMGVSRPEYYQRLRGEPVAQ